MDAAARLTLVILSLAALSTAGCGGSSSPTYGGAPGCTASTAAATSQVTIQNMSFAPACIKVAAGTVVTFTNNDVTTHTVTADDGSYRVCFDSAAASVHLLASTTSACCNHHGS